MNACSGECDWLGKVGVCRRMCLGCQDAFCEHLCHLHTKAKQGSPRGHAWAMRKFSPGKDNSGISGPGGAKAAKGHHLKHRAYINCPFLSFLAPLGLMLSRGIEKELGESVQPKPAQSISLERWIHICVKFIFPPPATLLRFSWSCKALKSRQYPGEGSAVFTHQLESQDRFHVEILWVMRNCSSHVISSFN